MPSYLTPGVYFERADAAVPPIVALRTDIAGFVGIAERGPLHRAIPVQSWRQFQATFGNFTGSGYLAYVVKGFFENGGRKCYVVRVADRHVAANASVILLDSNKIAIMRKPAWRLEASSPGVWGNQLAIQLRTTHRAQTRTVLDLASTDNLSSRVASVTNFESGTLVRLFQANAVPVQTLAMVKEVDGDRQRLVWRDPLNAAFMLGVSIFVESIEYTLTVYWQGRVAAVYEGLTLASEHPRYAPDVVRVSPLQPSDSRADLLPLAPPLVVVRDQVAPADALAGADFLPPASVEGLVLDTPAPVLFSGGFDGLETLSVNDFMGDTEDLMASDDERASRRRGIRALELIDEVSILAVPDIHIRPVAQPRTAPLPLREGDDCRFCAPEPRPPMGAAILPEQPPTFSDEDIFRVQSALVAQCEELRDRFALLDPPFSAARDSKLGAGAILSWRSRFESTYAALYFSWLRVTDPLRLGGQVVRELPPSGHVAGIFARTDFDPGVHKAPANCELQWAEDTTVFVDEATQAGLNPLGVNAIRSFPGRGLRLYGARTVSSDPDWRYVNVRRLLMMIEEALDVATQWVVFEPNDIYTRSKVRLAITSFLETLWRRGALAGAQPEEAFFVRCDDDNNPADGREQGRLRADVGVAPSVPYEFVVLRLGRTAAELELIEL